MVNIDLKDFEKKLKKEKYFSIVQVKEILRIHKDFPLYPDFKRELSKSTVFDPVAVDLAISTLSTL